MAKTPQGELVAAPHGLAGLIVEAVPPRARKAVNTYVIGKLLFELGKRYHAKWQDRTRYQITVPGNDDLFDDLREWLLLNTPQPKRRAVQAVTSRGGQRLVHSNEPWAIDDSLPRAIVPRGIRLLHDQSVGAKFHLAGHTVYASVTRPESNWSGQGHAHEYEQYMSQRSNMVLTCQSPEARDAVLSLLGDLVEARADKPEPPRLYLATRWGHWSRRDFLRPRPASTVVLEKGLAEELMADMRDFLGGEDEYALLGMPWHRGYLFEGPPGAGKTSIAQALATTFDLDVYWMPIRDVEDDSTLIRLISEVSSRCVLLLEDIDVLRAAHSREDEAPTQETTINVQPGASLQGLLNALDGMLTPHGLITIMTTNHVDDLDEALLRPGRTDVNKHIGPLAAADLERLIEMLLGSTLPVPRGVTAVPSEVVNVVKRHLFNKAEAREALQTWINEQPVTVP